MRRTEFHVPRASSSNYRHCTSTSWLLLSTYVSRIGITTMGIMWLMITAINHGHPYKSTERERERQCHNNVHHAVTLLLLRLLLLLYPMNCTYPGITSCTLCLYCDTHNAWSHLQEFEFLLPAPLSLSCVGVASSIIIKLH